MISKKVNYRWKISHYLWKPSAARAFCDRLRWLRVILAIPLRVVRDEHAITNFKALHNMKSSVSLLKWLLKLQRDGWWLVTHKEFMVSLIISTLGTKRWNQMSETLRVIRDYKAVQQYSSGWIYSCYHEHTDTYGEGTLLVQEILDSRHYKGKRAIVNISLRNTKRCSKAIRRKRSDRQRPGLYARIHALSLVISWPSNTRLQLLS